jgi:hypothetical protein
MQATLGGRELIQLAINREKESFVLYSRATVQDKSDERCPYCSAGAQISVGDRAQSLLANYMSGVTIGNIADQTGLRERYISLHG